MDFGSIVGISAFGNDEKDKEPWLVVIFTTEISTDGGSQSITPHSFLISQVIS